VEEHNIVVVLVRKCILESGGSDPLSPPLRSANAHEPPSVMNPPTLNSNHSTLHLIGTRGEALLRSSLAENRAEARHSPCRVERGCRLPSLLVSLSPLCTPFLYYFLETLTPGFTCPGLDGVSPSSWFCSGRHHRPRKELASGLTDERNYRARRRRLSRPSSSSLRHPVVPRQSR
jgi:hypothetical protein